MKILNSSASSPIRVKQYENDKAKGCLRYNYFITGKPGNSGEGFYFRYKSAITKAANRMLAIPFVVAKAIFTLLTSSGFTIRC